MRNKYYAVFDDVNEKPVTNPCDKRSNAFKEWVKSVSLETYLNALDNYSIVRFKEDDFGCEPVDDGIKIKDYLANVLNVNF